MKFSLYSIFFFKHSNSAIWGLHDIVKMNWYWYRYLWDWDSKKSFGKTEKNLGSIAIIYLRHLLIYLLIYLYMYSLIHLSTFGGCDVTTEGYNWRPRRDIRQGRSFMVARGGHDHLFSLSGHPIFTWMGIFFDPLLHHHNSFIWNAYLGEKVTIDPST